MEAVEERLLLRRAAEVALGLHLQMEQEVVLELREPAGVPVTELALEPAVLALRKVLWARLELRKLLRWLSVQWNHR